MKMRNLYGAVAALCVIGPTANAEEWCPGGLIQEQVIDGDLVVKGGTCSVISSIVEGDLRVIDSSYVTLLNNEITGEVLIARSDGTKVDGVANIIANTVHGGNMTIRNQAVANVIDNETAIGSIRVNGNNKALVQKNIAAYNLICQDNDDLKIFVNFANERLNCE